MTSVHPKDIPIPSDLEEIRVCLAAAGELDTWLDNESWDEFQTHALVVCAKSMGPLLDAIHETDQGMASMEAELDTLFRAILQVASIPAGHVTDVQLLHRLTKIAAMVQAAWAGGPAKEQCSFSISQHGHSYRCTQDRDHG